MASAANDLSKQLVKEGQRIFKEVLPKKCMELTKLITSELFTISPDITVVEAELNKVTDQQPPPANNAATTNKKRKRRKVATLKGPGADGLAGMGSGSDSDSDASDHEHEKPIFFPPVPCNTGMGKIITALKKEVHEAIDHVGAVKLWIQLCVPPIESGGQFSVGVQEECLRVLGTFEEQGYHLIESITKYYQGRARMVAKLQRHPSVMDYRQTILELDQLEFMNLRNAALDLRNSYLVCYDILTKNSPNLAPPRSMNSGMVV